MTAGSVLLDDQPDHEARRVARELVLRPATAPAVFSVDVEDYYQVAAFDSVVRRADWRWYPSRIEANVDRLLDLCDRRGVRGTFFVLGWEAKHRPAMVRRIADRGHELGCHSYFHRRVFQLTPAAFRHDTAAALAAIEDAAGVPVRGYRAPSFSITRRSLWAFDVLIELGFEYDSSVFPVRHPEYGIADAPSAPHVIRRAGGEIWEIPPATTGFFGRRLAVAGGGYLRHLPFPVVRAGLRRLVRSERQPAMLYVHPWEVDPDQPRLASTTLTRLRHYRNLSRTLPRLERLLSEFRFVTAGELVARAADDAATAGAASSALREAA